MSLFSLFIVLDVFIMPQAADLQTFDVTILIFIKL